MRKKLLIFSDCFTYSGSENVIENLMLSEELNRLFDVQFLYTYNPDYDRRFKERANQFNIDLSRSSSITVLNPDHAIYQYKLNRLKGVRKAALFMKKWLLLLLRVSFISYFVNVFLLRKAFKKINPDILFINNGGYPASLVCRLAVFAGKKAGVGRVVFNINNMTAPVRRFYENYIDNYIKNNVDVFVTASFAAQHSAVEVRNFPRDKFIRIPNTIFDEERLMVKTVPAVSDESAPILFGAVGLLTERKGFHVLLDAVSLLISEYNFTRFMVQIIGDGEERKNLYNQVRKLGIERWVDFKGFQQKPLDFVKSFDVFVLSSTKNEDFPYVIIEAMLLSKPVIGTRVAGVPEQVCDGSSGYVVPPNDAGELAQAMLRFQDAEFAKQAGHNSFNKYINEFSYKKVVSIYTNMLSGLVRK